MYIPLATFFLFSTGLKWMVGIRHTSCMGLASTKIEFFFSQPAPCRNRPLMYTPSLGGPVMLESSTVITLNSHDNESTDTLFIRAEV